ncbi:MAG: DUF167 domain-containing protein [Dehalococcoidia bacterium]|nr:DUF167 domain-containing protein [Dehalococcoidia bacterium]
MAGITTKNKDVIISAHVTPGAKANAVTGFKEGEWRIKIAAPPVDGKANEKLVEFLCSVLKLNKSAISITKGQSSRRKLIRIDGLSDEQISACLSALAQIQAHLC